MPRFRAILPLGLLVAWAFAAPILVTAQGGPTTASAPGPAKDVHVTDPAGDVRMEPNGQPAPREFDHLDILAFWVANETLNDIEFGLAMRTLDSPGSSTGLRLPYMGSGISMEFLVGKAEYKLEVGDTSSPTCGGYLEGTHRYENGYTVQTRCVPARVEAAEAILRFQVPRQLLTNETFVTFGAGDRIEGLRATATTAPGETVPFLVSSREMLVIHDRAPDVGVGPMYESALSNVTSSGDLSLFTPEPIRLSNGESTTLVYPVTVTNHGATSATALLSVDNPEPSWSIRVPPRVEIASGESVEVPVILSMGFDHRHGEIAFFPVRAESAFDPDSWSLIHLGVYWLDVPQPAGHHNTMHLHSGQAPVAPRAGYGVGIGVYAAVCEARVAWFSPVEDASQDAATDEPVASCPENDLDVLGNTYATSPSVGWSLELYPALLIGLDFDVSQPAQLVTTVESPVSTPGAVLEATLRYCDTTTPANPSSSCPGEWTVIGQGASASRALTASAPVPFEVGVEVLPIAEFLPFMKNSNLRLELVLKTPTPTHAPNVGTADTSPVLHVRGSQLVLPLVEYHDPVDQAFQNVGSLSLNPLAAFEKFANPGQTLVFPFEIVNHADHAQEVVVSIEGHNKEWARVAVGATSSLRAQERGNVTLLVDVPFDAAEGERSELFVVAESASEPNVVAVTRLRASVVASSTRVIEPEPGFQPPQAESTPSVPLAAIASTVLAAAILMRGRRH